MHAAHDVRIAFFNDRSFCEEEEKQRFFGVANADGLVGLIQDQYLGVERQYLARVYAVANWTLVCCLCTEELRTSVTQNNTSSVFLCSNSARNAIHGITNS